MRSIKPRRSGPGSGRRHQRCLHHRSGIKLAGADGDAGLAEGVLDDLPLLGHAEAAVDEIPGAGSECRMIGPPPRPTVPPRP